MLLLLLTEDLQLEEQLLLLQEPSIRGVHWCLGRLLLLVRRNILVVLELLHPGLRLFPLLAAALLGGLLLALLLWATTWKTIRNLSRIQHAMETF